MANLNFNEGRSPEFTFTGNSPINLSDYNSKLIAVYQQQEDNSWASYLPGSELNLRFNSLEFGKVYSVWAKEPFTIVY